MVKKEVKKMIEKVLIEQNFPLLVKGIESICWNGGCNDEECSFYKNKKCIFPIHPSEW